MIVHLRNEATIGYHHSSALKLKNTCRLFLTQCLFSWSSPVVPKVRIETKTEVEKGQKMCRAEGSQTGVAYLQHYVCLSVSVCSIGAWEKVRPMATIKNELSNLLPKIIHTIVIFSYVFWDLDREVFKLRYGWRSQKFGIRGSSHTIVNG